MPFIRGFRVPKHQQFDYKPRYWDPQKEELEERLQRIEEMKQGGIEGSKARIAGNLRRSYKGNQGYRRKQVLRSNIILLAVIVGLVFLMIYIFQLSLPELENFMGK